MHWTARSHWASRGTRAVARPVAWALASTIFLAVAPRAAGARGEVGVAILDPPGARVELARLGADAPEAATAAGPPLLPGDLLSCTDEGVAVELNCPPGSANSYSLASPFRVVIGVPSSGECHLDLLGGSLGVLTEAGTEVTAGGIEIRSVSTWYEVRVRRGAEGVEQEVDAFDDVVEVSLGDEVTELSDAGLSFAGGAMRRVREISATEAARSATIYSRLELRKAEAAGLAIEDRERALEELQAGYYAVMLAPRDQDRRLRLADTQLRYQVERKAVYHLEKAEAADPERFRAQPLDWTTIRVEDLSEKQKAYVERKRVTVLSPQEPVVELPARPSTPRSAVDPLAMDLARIERGETDAAIESLVAKIRAGGATSREYYALARAYLARREPERATDLAKQALELYESDGRLLEEELVWIKRVLRDAARRRPVG